MLNKWQVQGNYARTGHSNFVISFKNWILKLKICYRIFCSAFYFACNCFPCLFRECVLLKGRPGIYLYILLLHSRDSAACWREMGRMPPVYKVLTYIEYRAVSGVFRTIDPPSPLHPASVSSPLTKGGGGDTLAGRVNGWGVNGRRQTLAWPLTV